MRITGYDAEAAGTTAGDTLEVNAWRGSALLAASLDVTGWALSWDANRQVQGQGTFTVADPEGRLAPWGLSDALAPGGSRLQVTWVSGLSGLRIPLGWWRIRKADPTESWRLVPTTTPTGTVGAPLHTNLVTNPDAETYAAVATTRTNLAQDPRATAFHAVTNYLGYRNTRWFGAAPAAGTYTLVTGATDGPVAGVTTYARKTWTVAPTTMGNSGDTGFDHSQGGNPGLTVTPGQVLTISSWLRPSRIRNVVMSLLEYNAGVQGLRVSGTTVTAQPGVWTRVSLTYTVPASGVTTVTPMSDSTSATTGGATIWAVGDTLDGTALLVEAVAAVPPYFDGATRPPLRTNRAPNPRGASATGWAVNQTGSTPTASSVTVAAPFPGGPTTAFRATSVLAGAQLDVRTSQAPATMIPVEPGRTYRYRISGMFSAAGALTLYLQWVQPNGTLLGTTTLVQPALAANTWTTLTGTIAAPALSGGVSLVFRKTDTSAAGVWVQATAVAVELDGAGAGSYFDGATPVEGYATAWSGTANASASVVYDPDYTYAWSGTANASTSLQRAPGVTGPAAFSGGNSVRWSSVTEHARGARSWAFRTTVFASTGLIWNLATGGANALSGQWVTFRAKVKAPVGRGYSVSCRTSGGAGQGTASYVGTGAWQDVYTTSAATADGQLVGAQLVTSNPVGTEFFVDEATLVLEPAAYTGPYFDGRTPDTAAYIYGWTGAADASTTTWSPRVMTYASAVVRLPGGGQVEVSADEETSTVILSRLDAEVPVGPGVLAEVTRLLRDICPVKILGGVTDADVPATLVYADSRMDAVEDLLTIIRATHRMAGDGTLEVLPEAGVGPVWTLAGGDEGVLVGLSRALSDDAIYNAVRSDNETAEGQPLVGRAYITSGPLAWGGPYGKVPLFHKAIATTAEGVQDDATTSLATRQAAGEVDLAVTCLAHPGLQPHDRVTIMAPTIAGDAPITGRVVGMTLRDAASGGLTPAKSMGLTVRVSTDTLEAIAARVRRA